MHEIGIDGVCIGALLLVWFLISIPYQTSTPFGKRIQRLNTFGLIPGWTFFAPTPGVTDYRFVVRDRGRDGYTPWHELEWCRTRRPLDALWHPSRYRTKLIVDCVGALSTTVQELKRSGIDVERESQTWMISVPYLVLLNAASSLPRLVEGATARQFAVLEQDPSRVDQHPRVIVCSPAHDL
jgi:hypothetical protein